MTKLIKPHISEKATEMSEEGFYVFRVKDTANKTEVKRELEEIYKVHIESVRIIKAQSKKKRVGRIEGRRKGYKKAVVKVKKGERIDITSLK